MNAANLQLQKLYKKKMENANKYKQDIEVLKINIFLHKIYQLFLLTKPLSLFNV